ncbi:MAG: hypothetical protein LBM41_00715 [Ruminococcus sp.]|jgi:hypothetical protein|nr:hypothetical protein [Ruminococcus sp.]
MDHIFCPKCGFKNDIKNKFCMQCGEQLASVKAAVIKPTTPPPSPFVETPVIPTPIAAKKKSNPAVIIAGIAGALLLCVGIGFGAIKLVELAGELESIPVFEDIDKEETEDEPETTTEATTSETITTTEAVGTTTTTEATTTTKPSLPDEGKVLNIYAYTTEPREIFETYFNSDYGYELPEDVEVNWEIIASVDGAYQALLDENLPENDNLPADERIDLIILENSFAGDYIYGDYLMNVADLGFTESDLSDQYKFTHQLASDGDGNIKGLAYHAAPSAFYYRRSFAKEVFGTDEPDEIQKELSSWARFDASAWALDSFGYYITASYSETFRPFRDSSTTPVINADGNLEVPQSWRDWADHAKKYRDNILAHYAEPWSENWYGNMKTESLAFGFIGPLWFADYVLADNTDFYADWAICEGPAPSYWGGSMISAAAGTDNEALAAEIMKCLTLDPDVAYDLSANGIVYANSITAMNRLSASSDGEYGLLGGQNPFEVFNRAGQKLDLGVVSPNTEDISAEFAYAMYDYIDSEDTYQSCYNDFLGYVENEYGLTP